MAKSKDEDIRIFELPEATSLPAGMYVAVDNETLGTKKYNISEALDSMATSADVEEIRGELESKADTEDLEEISGALESKADSEEVEAIERDLEDKLDSPSAAPTSGQILTFDGTNNVWSNPQEGVYILNYSEVTSYNDIDAQRAGSQPTFIKIDSSVPLTVQGISGSNTINMENQIMQLTDYNVNNAWHVFRGYNMGSFPGNYPTADRVGSNYHFEVVLQIFRPEVTQHTKLWSVFGDYMDGRNVFSTEPQPYTVSYQNGKGSDLSGKTGRSTAVQFTASNGEYRKNLLMPYEIQDHDFSDDTTPEQIQFMGWGVTSNRAGYKNMLTAKDWIETNTNPEQTPTLKVSRFINGNPVNYSNDQIGMSLQATVKSADGQTTETWTGNLLTGQFKPGCLQTWDDSNGRRHTDWKPVNELPPSSAQLSGRVLTVDSTGNPAWDLVPTELPSSTSADEGKVLTVGSNGGPGWDYPEEELPSYDNQTLVGTYLSVCSGSNNNELRWEEVSAGRGLSTRQDTYQGHSTKVIEVDSDYKLLTSEEYNNLMAVSGLVSTYSAYWVLSGTPGQEPQPTYTLTD
jgi:flagellin-like hook-associated protein FlgL